jgi:hypothetical protein
MHLIATAKDHQRERTFCWRVIQEVIMSTESNERTKVELHGSVTSQELIGYVDCVLAVRHDNPLLERMTSDDEHPDRSLPFMAKLFEELMGLTFASVAISKLGTAKMGNMIVAVYFLIEPGNKYRAATWSRQVGNENPMVAPGTDPEQSTGGVAP